MRHSRTLRSCAPRPHACPQGCNAAYQCIYHYLSDDSKLEVSWDFRPLCKADGSAYFYRDAVGQNYSFNVCGNVSTPCVHRGAINPASHGVMVQSWGAGPFVNPACKVDVCGIGNPLCCEDKEYPGYYR